MLDPQADQERRLDGALLVATFMSDVAIIRRVFVKVEGDDG